MQSVPRDLELHSVLRLLRQNRGKLGGAVAHQGRLISGPQYQLKRLKEIGITMAAIAEFPVDSADRRSSAEDIVEVHRFLKSELPNERLTPIGR